MLAGCYKSDSADLIIHNAKIYSCDENFSIYEAMAIRDGKIIQMGPEREILNGYKCDNIIDAEMKPIYPGFHDAHCHFYSYAQTLAEVDLFGTESFEEVVKRIQSHAAKMDDKNVWITGRGWDQSKWESDEFPTNDTLNQLFPDQPIAVRRVDGHAVLVNQKALDIAGITPETKIAGGDIIVVDGRCTGILLDNAFDTLRQHIPEWSTDKKLEYLQKAEMNLFEEGITSINDAGIYGDEREEYINWYRNGDLKIKDYAMLFPDDDNLDFASDVGIFKEGNLSIRSFKMLSDGAMGSWGACMIEPYHDHESHGFMLADTATFRSIAQFAKEINYQVNIHAIGDSANRAIIDIYAEVVQDKFDHRWKIEHAQVLHPDDFDRFAAIGIVPSVQPTHCTSDMHWVEGRLGKERAKFAYAYKLLLEKTGRIALGTDFPIENISALETFYAAVTRMDKKGNPEGGFYPEQALSREEALRGMTIWAAWSNFEDLEKGSLEEGKDADFVILTKDIMKVPAEEILTTFVLRTFLDGKEVFVAE